MIIALNMALCKSLQIWRLWTHEPICHPPPPPPPATHLQSSVFESQHRVNLSFLLQNTDVNHKQCSSNVEKEGCLLRWKTIETFEWYRGSGWWTWLTRDKIIREICPINVLGRGLYGEVAIMSRMLKYFGHGVRHTDMKNWFFWGGAGWFLVEELGTDHQGSGHRPLKTPWIWGALSRGTVSQSLFLRGWRKGGYSSEKVTPRQWCVFI